VFRKGGDYIGTELDFFLRYAITKEMSFTAGWAICFAGNYFEAPAALTTNSRQSNDHKSGSLVNRGAGAALFSSKGKSKGKSAMIASTSLSSDRPRPRHENRCGDCCGHDQGGESQILVVLDDEKPDVPLSSGEEVSLHIESEQVHIQRRGENAGPSITGGLSGSVDYCLWICGRPRRFRCDTAADLPGERVVLTRNAAGRSGA